MNHYNKLGLNWDKCSCWFGDEGRKKFNNNDTWTKFQKGKFHLRRNAVFGSTVLCLQTFKLLLDPVPVVHVLKHFVFRRWRSWQYYTVVLGKRLQLSLTFGGEVSWRWSLKVLDRLVNGTLNQHRSWVSGWGEKREKEGGNKAWWHFKKRLDEIIRFFEWLKEL